MKNTKTALTRLTAALLCLLLSLTACTKFPGGDIAEIISTTSDDTKTVGEDDITDDTPVKKIIGSERLVSPFSSMYQAFYYGDFDIMVNYTRWSTEWSHYYKDSGDGFYEMGRIVIGKVEKVIEVIDIEPLPAYEYSEEVVELPEYSDDEDHETDDLSVNYSDEKEDVSAAYQNDEYEEEPEYEEEEYYVYEEHKEDPDFEPEFEGDMRNYEPECATVYNIVVEKNFYGDETKTLKLYLYGTPDSPLGTTKPEIGDRLLLVLLEDEEGYCHPINFEMSMFRINENETVYSFHDDEAVAQFDGKPLSVLEDKILEILGKKFTGSDAAMETYSVPSTFEELVTNVKKPPSGCKAVIVTGKVESVKSFLSDNGITYYRFHVDKTLYGQETDWLKLCLFGSPNSNVGITKPNVGDNLLLLLWVSTNTGSYSPTSQERSMFRINDDGTVYSFHNDESVAQFDGKSIEFLESAILDILEG